MMRLIIGFKCFTPANTGLDKPSYYPEMGSVFKAAFLKACAWFFAKTAVELSEKNPEEPGEQRSVKHTMCSTANPGLYNNPGLICAGMPPKT